MKRYGVTANVVCPRALTRMTASVPGAEEYMSGPEWDPDNIAPMVAFLASDAAADISGQVFVVWGPRVHLMRIWQPAFTLDRGEGRYTVQELIDRKGELFADGRKSKIPPAGFGL
jgi:3-oxoacyl-[acyl-carrier protein] reductase